MFEIKNFQWEAHITIPFWQSSLSRTCDALGAKLPYLHFAKLREFSEMQRTKVICNRRFRDNEPQCFSCLLYIGIVAL